MQVRNFFVIIVLLSITCPALAQEEGRASERARLKKELQSEINDSIRNANRRREDESRFTNNSGIQRDALNISFKVKDILYRQDSVTLGDSIYPAVTMIIPETYLERVKKAWVKEIRKKTKSKVLVETDGISIQSTSITSISPSPINIFSHLRQEDHHVVLAAAFETDGGFITSSVNASQYENVKGFLNEFGLEQYRLAVKDQIKAAKKVLKARESELSKLQKENEKMHTHIKSNEMNIINTENDIKENHNDQDLKIDEMKSKKEVISRSKGENKKEAEKELKGLQKDRKKLQNDNKNMSKKIVKYRASIEETRRDITLNLSEQDLQKSKVSEQLSAVKSLEEKLMSIK